MVRLKLILQAHSEELIQNFCGQKVKTRQGIPANMEMGKEMPFLIIQGITKTWEETARTKTLLPNGRRFSSSLGFFDLPIHPYHSKTEIKGSDAQTSQQWQLWKLLI